MTGHAWHRSLWYGHGIVNGQDFWRELGRDKTARLGIAGEPRPKQSAIDAKFSTVTAAGQTIGSITQTFGVSRRGSIQFIDALMQISADQKTSFTFGDTDDGGFAFRLNDHFREDRGAHLRNSEGLEGTKNIWGKAARWVDYSAVIDGAPAGVAIFDHPANLRHPTQWHARGYSLCSANPFASKSFSKGKGPDGFYLLPAGQQLTMKYRVIIHVDPFEPADLDALYSSWTLPQGIHRPG